MKRTSSGNRSLLAAGAAAVVFSLSTLNSHCLEMNRTRAPAQGCARPPVKHFLHAIPQYRKIRDWDSVTETPESDQVCRSRRTEIFSYGTIRLIDVGDDVQSLADFLAVQSHTCAERREKCLIAASLPSCPSCASIGYALANDATGRALGPLTLIRIDVEEFGQELRQLGLVCAEVPVFALLNDVGKITHRLDSSNLSSNNPADFLPILSDFIQGKPTHHRGGRYSSEGRALVKL